MSANVWAGLIVASILAVFVGSAALYLWLRFHNGPASQWRDNVASVALRWQTALRDTRRKIDDLIHRRKQQIEGLRTRWFDQFLTRIPIIELNRYPGIGPATIDKLLEFGFKTLKDVKTRSMLIPGIGEKRQRDIQIAFDQHLNSLTAEFLPGKSAEADRLEAAQQLLNRDMDLEQRRLDAMHAALQRHLPLIEELHTRADEITFPAYLAGKLDKRILAALLKAPLPDLERVLADAQQQANATPPEVRPRAQPTPLVPEVSPVKAPTAPRAAVNAPPSTPYVDPERDNRRLDAEVRFAYVVARCDGHRSRGEKQFIESHFHALHADDRATLNRVRGLCAFYENAALDADDCLAKIDLLFTPEEKQRLASFAAQLMTVSGGINAKEASFLERLRVEWQITPSAPSDGVPNSDAITTETKQIEVAPNRTERDPRAVLEIDAETALSPELVRRNYHRLMEKFDPAKVAELGPEFVQMAEAKREQIEEAAQALIAPFQQELAWPEKPSPPSDLRHNPDLDDLFGA